MPDDTTHPGVSISASAIPSRHEEHMFWLDGEEDDDAPFTVSYDMYGVYPDWSVDLNLPNGVDEHSTIVIPWHMALAIREKMAWMEANLNKEPLVND